MPVAGRGEVDVSGAEYMGEVLATCCPSIDLSVFESNEGARERWQTQSGLTGASIQFVHDAARAAALVEWARTRPIGVYAYP